MAQFSPPEKLVALPERDSGGRFFVDRQMKQEAGELNPLIKNFNEAMLAVYVAGTDSKRYQGPGDIVHDPVKFEQATTAYRENLSNAGLVLESLRDKYEQYHPGLKERMFQPGATPMPLFENRLLAASKVLDLAKQAIDSHDNAVKANYDRLKANYDALMRQHGPQTRRDPDGSSLRTPEPVPVPVPQRNQLSQREPALSQREPAKGLLKTVIRKFGRKV